MAFCPSCGAENPDAAKFCAKCGQPLVVVDNAATQPQAPVAVQPQPAAPAPQPQPAAPAPQPQPAAPAPQPQPAAPAPQPRPAVKPTAKEALAAPPVPKPAKVRNEPDPNAPNQTQFFMAAAGVSTASKIKRVILFIIGAVIVGTGIFLLIEYGFIKKEPPKVKAKAGQSANMEPMNAPAKPQPTEPAVQQPKPDEAAAKDSKEPPKPSTQPKGKKKSH